ncbi:MAG: hypothetical protein B6D61_13615 [Bacteroidetes bacterium 4484_249]|nr:MAG: hypothetical protein B6D61_13615 [Bacteroidetes bacterium 4484_249]
MIIFLSSATFFSFAYLPRQVLLLISFSGTVLVVLVSLLGGIYDRGKKFPMNFTVGVSFIILSAIISMLGAYFGHQQGFLLSLWVQSPMYLYFFYFFLHTTRIKPDELERLIIIMAVLWMIFYFIQYLIYPKIIFDVRVQEARGTIRVFLPGGAFAVLMYFYFLQSFFRTNNLLHVGFCFGFLVITLISGTRSAILPVVFVTLLNLIFSKRVKSKFMITFFMLLGVVIVFFIFQDLIIGLIKLSETQASQEGEDIRMRSARFYLTEFYPNFVNYIIGNGSSHMANAYGMKVMYYQTVFGYYLSDLGMLGVYVRLGVLYIIGVFLIFRKIFITPYDSRYTYFKYATIMLIWNEIGGGAFAKPTSFIVTLAMLYIIDVSAYQLSQGELAIKNNTS